MSRNSAILILTYLCAAAAFIIDVVAPVGYAEWFIYLIPFVVLSLNFEPASIYLLATFSSVLMVLGFIFSAKIVPLPVGITNLVAAELALWAFTFFLVNHTKLYNRYKNTTILDDAIFSSMNEGLIVADLEGNIKSVNKAAFEISGSQDLEQCRCMLFSEDLCEVYDSDGNKLPLEQWPFSRVLRLDHFDAEDYEIRRKDGSISWFGSFSGTPVYNQKGAFTLVLLTFRDVTDRKKTESERERLMAELTQQHELLEQIIENAPLAVALFKGEECRFILGNSRFNFFAKGEKENSAAKEIWNRDETFWLSELRKVYTSCKISFVNDRPFNIETEDGPREALYTILFIPFLFNDNTKGVLIIARDTTAEVQDRRVIEETAARDEAILNSLTDGLIISDPSGKIMKMNPAALQMHGLESSDEVNNQISNFSQLFKVHDSDGNPLPFGKQPFSRVLRKEKFSAMDIMVHRGDNKIWYASYSGTPVIDKEGRLILVLLTIRDVTELRERTREAVEAKRILDAIMDYSPNVMIIAAAPIGVVIRASKSMSDLLETPLEKIQGDVEHPELWKMNRTGSTHDDFKTMPLYRAINYGELVRDEEWVIRRNGNEIYVSLDVGPIRDEKGKITAAVSTWRDVTERKRVERERERLNSELRQRASELENTNSELEAFAYSVSHDLRAPLRTIMGFITIITEDYGEKLDKTGRDFLSRVQAGAQKMNDLIEDMLRLSRITRQEMTLQQVDLSKIVSSILDELKTSAPERKAEFLVQNNVIVQADPKLIQIALENLIRNSWKFTAKKDVAHIEFGTSVRDDKKEYFIRDNGAGFDMRFAERLFKPFQRLHSDKEFSGTGIGLAIVLRVIRRHGGNIRAEGEVNKGAAFYFTLG
jgi:PAS domain S-box-containing protein